MTVLTLKEYKTRHQITSEDEGRDEALSAAIFSAEDAAARYAGRDFATEPAVETRQYPFEGPVVNIDDCTSITSVTLDSVPLIADLDYLARPYSDPVFYWLDLGPYTGRPASPLMGFTRNEDVIARRPFRFVTVTATFGWPEPVPPAVALAVSMLVDDTLPLAPPHQARSGISAEAVADTSIVYESPETTSSPPGLPPAVEQLLDPFRRITL